MNAVGFNTIIEDGKNEALETLNEEKPYNSLRYINPEYLVETPEEIERRKKRQSIPPEDTVAAFKQFWETWDAVEDEPLDEKFDQAINAPWVFRTKVAL